jgi:hypothetical protein
VADIVLNQRKPVERTAQTLRAIFRGNRIILDQRDELGHRVSDLLRRCGHDAARCGLTFALTCDGAFLLRARRRQVQRVVRQRALSLGRPPWLCKTVAARPVLHRQV